MEVSICAFMQAAHEILHLSAVGAHRLGFQNLPLHGSGAAEFKRGLAGSGELDAADLVAVEGQQALVA